MEELSSAVRSWESAGFYVQLLGKRIFVRVFSSRASISKEPLLVLHGFPTCSYDFVHVANNLCAERDVIFFDMLGYGLSEKPDVPYRLADQADIAQALLTHLEISTFSLLTHDMGDTVGGELLARNLEGDFDANVVKRIISNGSIYIEMAHLTDGQLFLLSLPDESLGGDAPLSITSLAESLRATLTKNSVVGGDELIDHANLIHKTDGHLLLPRTIRYIEERRAHQGRFTGAIESHPSPLGIVWGRNDPIAVAEMATALQSKRPEAQLSYLDGVGHYPMIESPSLFSKAVLAYL